MMAAWRILASMVVSLAAVTSVSGQTVSLTETAKVGDCFNLHLEMKLAGEMHVRKDGKPVSLKLEATAVHDFPERILSVGERGLLTKTARYYEAAKALVTTEAEHTERLLRSDRRLLVAQRQTDRSLVYCPAGPLTREELELTSEHFDTLSLAGLLPTQEVAAGATWKVGNEIAQTLCSFEGLASQDLTCKLEEIKDQTAVISIKGSATGIDLGAQVKLTIQASARFDLGAHHLTFLEWKQKDERDQGPASPASVAETTTTITRTPIDQPASLSDVALISVPDGFDPPATMTQLLHHHEGRTSFDLIYSRDWQIVGHTRERTILRYLERGDFVAQATLTPLDRAKAGDHMTAEAFREAMTKMPGWEQGDVVQEGEIPAGNGRWIYHISAPGKMDGLKVVQNFFLLAGPKGEQVAVAFTMTPGQAEKLGSRDVALVQGIEFTSSPREASRP
jgi:hypothetical protein